MTTLTTQRLRLRRLVPDDAAFILTLLNEPSFIDNIGDKGVRSLDDARAYIRDGPVASYAAHGFGLDLVEHTASTEPIGLCGLLQRDNLDHPDLGYAFLPSFWSQGYAQESARGVMAYARETLGLARILAVVSPGNAPSIRLLEKLGFRCESMIAMAEGEAPIKLFADG